MQVTLNTLVNTAESMRYLSTLRLRANKSFQVATFMRKSAGYLQTYETQRKTLLEQFATLSEDETSYNLPKENRLDFFNAHQELVDVVIEGLSFPKIDFNADFGQQTTIVPQMLAALTPFCIKNIDPESELKSVQGLSLTRGELALAYSSLSALGRRTISRNAGKAILHNLAVLQPVVTNLRKEEEMMQLEAETEEAGAEALAELYKGNDSEVYNLAYIDLDAMGDFEIEASAYNGIENLILETNDM